VHARTYIALTVYHIAFLELFAIINQLISSGQWCFLIYCRYICLLINAKRVHCSPCTSRRRVWVSSGFL